MPLTDNLLRILYTISRHNLIYRIYERHLIKEINQFPFPQHIGIILDGNRRWSKIKDMDKVMGHQMGADIAEDMLNWIYDLGIKITTVYVLSNENLGRDKIEIENIYTLLENKLSSLYNDQRIHKKQIRIKSIGDFDILPRRLQEILFKLEDTTKS